jgi:hypothetical protein
MPVEIARAGILIGVFVLVASVPLLIFGTPGTPEFAITVFTVLIGTVFTLGIILVVRLSKRR